MFSSRVATSRGSEVLVVGDKCATLNRSSLFTTQNIHSSQSYLASRIRSSANYEANCHRKSRSAEKCRTLVRDTLPITITKGDPCPFPRDDRICRSPASALRLDSGFLDSHRDLGINSQPSPKFLYRTVNECAPIKDEGYMNWNISAKPQNVQFLYEDDPVICGENQSGCTRQFDIVRFGEGGPRTARSEYGIS